MAEPSGPSGPSEPSELEPEPEALDHLVGASVWLAFIATATTVLTVSAIVAGMSAGLMFRVIRWLRE